MGEGSWAGLFQKSKGADDPVVLRRSPHAGPPHPALLVLDVYGLAAPARGALPGRGAGACTTELT